ncbi:MAG TPA: hypothetical protein VHF06_13760 [Pseudonocardiaceae bacterium]|nr:hypothetical protein [Pseudonocardiaceae bacterium]
MAANRFRLYSLALLGATTALVTAACSGTATTSANGRTTTVQWSTVLPSTPQSTAREVTLQFPNTAETVFISGYDAKTRMVQFVLSKWIPGGEDDGHFDDQPTTHRLPLASTVQIKAVLSLCAGMGEVNMNGVACTKANFLKALSQGQFAHADIHVDATDHIDAISERYAP